MKHYEKQFGLDVLIITENVDSEDLELIALNDDQVKKIKEQFSNLATEQK